MSRTLVVGMDGLVEAECMSDKRRVKRIQLLEFEDFVYYECQAPYIILIFQCLEWPTG